MKMKILLYAIIVANCFSACSSDDGSFNQEIVGESLNKTTANVAIAHPDSMDAILQGIIAEDAKRHDIGNPNSHLWITEGKGRAANEVIIAKGNIRTTSLKNYKMRFAGNWPDSRVRIWQNTIFLAYPKYYEIYIKIPHGATLVLPPAVEMAKMKNMGFVPTGGGIGYANKLIKEGADFDEYSLFTYGVEIQHDIEGRLIFSPPVYDPYNVTNPQTIEFKYMYQKIQW